MLAGMKLGGTELVGLVVAASFAAGLNVYATVATLGLLAHAGVLDLPSALSLLASWWVIGACGVLFLVEFFADKIPAFDLFWNALQTFVRIPVAALIAYGATAQLSPEKQLLATLAGGAIALAAHGGKTAARAAVTPSRASIASQNAVPYCEVFSAVMFPMRRWSSRSSVIARQTKPRPYLAMKLIASGVTFSAASVRSPSFSRSSSSTTTIMRPARISSTAVATSVNGAAGDISSGF